MTRSDSGWLRACRVALLTGAGLLGSGLGVRAQAPVIESRVAVPATPFAGFVENAGQWDTAARFVGRFPGMVVRVEPDALVLQVTSDSDPIRGVVVRLAFAGASSAVRMEGVEPRPGSFNFFRGQGPEQWHTDLRAFDQVLYRGLHDGVDLLLHVDGSGYLAYDLVCAPGVDPSGFRIDYQGAEDLDLVEGSPVAGAALRELIAAFPGPSPADRLDGPQTLRITHRIAALGASTSGEPGLAAPAMGSPIHWSRYLGSTRDDLLWAAALGPEEDVYVTGTTDDLSFPGTPGAFQSPSLPGRDAYVTRMSGSDGALVYSSVLGGSHVNDRAEAIAVDPTGAATVAGWSQSSDFPTTPMAYQPSHKGFLDAFVLRLSPMGNALIYSTFLGGSFSDQAYAVDVTPSGEAVFGGQTVSLDDFPTTPGAYKTSFGPTSGQAFVARLDPLGQKLEWSTLLGGSGIEHGVASIALDSKGCPTVGGDTGSLDFPTTPGAWTTSYSGRAVYVTRLNSSGSDLVWSSAFGGSGYDVLQSIALDASDGVVAAGATGSTNFPTTPGALQEVQLAPNDDTWVTRIRPDGSAPIYSTFLPSTTDTFAKHVAVDVSGSATLVGGATPGLTVTPGALKTQPQPGDYYVARLDPLGTRLLYSSFIGGPGSETGETVVLGPTRSAILGGKTSGGFPTTHTQGSTFNGGQTDAYVLKLDLLLDGVAPGRESVPSCLGPLAAGVTEMPAAGAKQFALTCSGAPPGASGWLDVRFPGSGAGKSGSPLGPYTELGTPLLFLPVKSDGDGWAEVPFPLGPGTTGLQFTCRFVFMNTPTCTGASTLCSSNTLIVTVQ